jgi:hypothetical protein
MKTHEKLMVANCVVWLLVIAINVAEIIHHW